jgi:hypothetical protein
LRVRLKTTEVSIKGPFLAQADAFLQQLKADDQLDLEVLVAESARYPREVELNWIARADAAAEQRLAGRPMLSAPLLHSLTVASQRRINSLVWSPDGSRLIVVAQPTTLWNTSTGELVGLLSSNECYRAEWSSEGKHIAIVEDGQDQIAVYEAGGKFVGARPTYAEAAPIIAANPKRSLLALVQRNPNPLAGNMLVTSASFSGKGGNQDLGGYSGFTQHAACQGKRHTVCQQRCRFALGARQRPASRV